MKHMWVHLTRKLLMSFLFFASAAPAQSRRVEFKFSNRIQFFSQNIGLNQLPTPVNLVSDLRFTFVIDGSGGPGLQKVFQTVVSAEELSAKIELFYFGGAPTLNENYFSQQITIFKNNNLVGKCSAYFSTDQRFLVPGACAGVTENRLFGLTLSK